MKAISLIKLLTLVGFLVVGFYAQADNENETKEVCRTRITKKNQDSIARICEKKPITTTNSAGVRTSQPPTEDDIDECKTKKLNELLNAECGDKETNKDKKASCRQAYKEYTDAQKKTGIECANIDVKDNKECREKAKSCKKSLDTFGNEGQDSETAAGAIVNLIGVYDKMQNSSGRNSTLNGCLIENDDSAKKEEERIDDKITKIREDIQDLKEKATEADKKLNEKRQEVEKDMLDVEKDADKAKFDKQTKNQEDAGRMQKAIMASETKRKLNLNKIADIQVEIANFSFAHQQLNLSLSDAIISKKCRDVSNAAIATKLKGSINPATGKEVKPKFSQQESAQFKKDLKLEETNCLQQAALSKQAKAKELIDAKRAKNVQIEALNSSNADEAKSVENELKQMEALKAISTEEEAKSIETKLKKLDTLNKSVVDMEKHIADKKKSYDEKSKAKDELISKLVLDRQNVKSRFAKVSSTAEDSKDRASDYLQLCCSDKNALDVNCTKVEKSDPDAPKGKKGISSTSI